MRYYYKDNNNNYYSFKSEHTDLIPITESEWNDHVSATCVPSPPEQLAKSSCLMRIDELKQLLANTDYLAIKYAERLISHEAYEPIKEQRQQWREEINRIEQEL